MTAPDDLWRHQPEPPVVDLDALPAARRHALRVRAALPDTPLPEPFGHDVRALVGEVLAPSDEGGR